MKRSPSLILLLIASFLAVGIIVLAVSSFFTNGTPSSTPPPSSDPTPTAITQSNPYEKESSDKMLEILENRKTLNAKDREIKELLKNIQKGGRYVYTSQNVNMEYLSSPDEFLAEVKTTNIDAAKAEIVTFLKSKGISDGGICYLPVIFYLNIDVKRNLPANTKFNPLPNDC